MAISSTLTAQFRAPGVPPARALEQWRRERPAWLPEKYREVDVSYKSVTWEWRHTGGLMKLVSGGFFGGATVYRLTALFDEDGRAGSRVTVNGSADPDTRAAIRAAAESFVEGGIV